MKKGVNKLVRFVDTNAATCYFDGLSFGLLLALVTTTEVLRQFSVEVQQGM